MELQVIDPQCADGFLFHHWVGVRVWDPLPPLSLDGITCRRCKKVYVYPTSILTGLPIPENLIVGRSIQGTSSGLVRGIIEEATERYEYGWRDPRKMSKEEFKVEMEWLGLPPEDVEYVLSTWRDPDE